MWTEGQREKVEATWRDHQEADDLSLLPAFGDVVDVDGATEREMVLEGGKWREKYLDDAQHVQEMGSTIFTPEIKTERGSQCRKSENRKQCRSGFPMEWQMSNESMVVCEGVAEQFQLPLTGRRNALGSLLGPPSCTWLNGTHPALLSVGRHNADVHCQSQPWAAVWEGLRSEK